jgi:ABC-type branched-subunit amino acid transport system substrate-binding protein
MKRRLARSRATIALAGGLAAALAFTACGADSTGSGGGDGDTIKIGMILPIDSAATSLPNTVAAAKVAEKAVNSRGGVNGKNIEVITCDDKADPATAATCVQKLLNNDNVIALGGSLSYAGDAIYPALKAANVVNFGNYPASAPDLQNPLSYPFVNGIGGWASVAAAGLSAPGTKVNKLAVVVTEGAAADVIFPDVTKAAQAKGVTTELVAIPITITNFAPIAAKIKASGADGIVLAPLPDQVAPAYVAFQQEGISDLPVIMAGGNPTDNVVKDIESRGYKPIWGVNLVQDPSKSALRKQYNDEIAQFGDEVGGVKDKLTEVTTFSWLSITKLADVLAELPTIDRKSLKEYLDKQSAFDTGMTEPLDFTNASTETFPRGFNRWASTGQLSGGEILQPDLTWIQQAS